MLHDLRRKQIECQRQEEYQIFYKDCLVGLQRLDLFIAKEIIVEIKVVSHVTRLHQAQTFSYLRAFNKRVGLLFNFGSSKPEFERIFFESRPSKSYPEDVERTIDELPTDLISPEVAYEIIGGLYTVHEVLGPGFISRIYANACLYEFKLRGLAVRHNKEMQVIYRGKTIANIKFDHLQVEDFCLVFPMAVTDINSIRFNNIKDWLRTEQIPLGIIANFHDITHKPLILKA